MPYRRKTWEEKLKDSKTFPKILKLEANFPCYRALKTMGAKPGDSVVIAPPLAVDAVMKNVPFGKLITLKGVGARDVGGVTKHLGACVDQQGADVRGCVALAMLVMQYSAVLVVRNDVAVG